MLAGITERLQRKDRAIVLLGLVGIVAVAWLYVIQLAASMSSVVMSGDMGMDGTAMDVSMPNLQAWQSGAVLLTFMMWAIMMVAMMTPSATPMILTFASMDRQRHADHTPILATAVFLLGYLVVWFCFSAIATLAQNLLQYATLLSPQMIRVTPLLGGFLLIFAGLYQFTPLKNICLSHCRTPLGFLMAEWRDGMKGALVMGMRHGIYCLGCCWLLMVLLFVAGVMNLLWVAIIALTVLVEKVIPSGQLVTRVIGLLTIGWGVWIVATVSRI